MSSIPSPILIIGDPYTGRNNILSIKNKFPHISWVTKSLDEDGLNSIRAEASTFTIDDSEKILLLQDLPDRKQVREFVLDLVSNPNDFTRIIVWDSFCNIKIDPKTKSMGKDWSEFLGKFKDIKGSKVLNNSAPFTEKDGDNVIDFIVEKFEKKGKHIGFKEARLLVNIIGFDRGMIDSDIKKMILTCPDNVDSQFIIDNAFPSSKEAIVYKLGNVIDTGSYENSIDIMDRFLSSGVSEHKIIDILIKKARWQMIIASLWEKGLNWNEITTKIMSMGKFPSAIWHNEGLDSEHKKRESELINTPEGIRHYITLNMGVPKMYIKNREDKKKKTESIPQYFMASQIVDFVREMVEMNSEIPDIKKKLVTRGIRVYRFIQGKLFDIKIGTNAVQDLQEIVRVLTNRDLSAF